MASSTQRITQQAWQRVNITVLLACVARSNKRAAFDCGLDDQNADTQPTNEPVATREIIGMRAHAKWKFGDDRSAFGNPLKKFAVCWRIEPIDTGTQHGNGRLRIFQPSRIERAAMGARIDP